MNLKIDKEFRLLIPPQRPDEHELLEESILSNGFDLAYPIITWNGFLVDGHNRYEICQKYGIEFTVSEKDFSSRREALNWIIDNQLSRRNITDDQRTYLIGKRYKEEKKAIGENQYTLQKEDNKSGVVTVATPKKTEQLIAEQSNVSPKTVRNAEKFAEAVDTVAENVGINPQKILSGQKTQPGKI